MKRSTTWKGEHLCQDVPVTKWLACFWQLQVALFEVKDLFRMGPTRFGGRPWAECPSQSAAEAPTTPVPLPDAPAVSGQLERRAN